MLILDIDPSKQHCMIFNSSWKFKHSMLIWLSPETHEAAEEKPSKGSVN